MSAGTTYQTAGEGRPRRGDPNRRSPRIDPREVAQAHRLVEAISRTFDSKVVGQEALRTALLVGLIGGGHVLLESATQRHYRHPGVQPWQRNVYHRAGPGARQRRVVG